MRHALTDHQLRVLVAVAENPGGERCGADIRQEIGLASGTYTCIRICQADAPSTVAASSSSRGTVLKVWRSRKMPKAEAK